MDELILLHNPRCSKSRAALALLESRGLQARVIDYLANPPSIVEIERLLGLLAIEPRALMRTDDALYVELGLDDPQLGPHALIAALHANPRLLQRPIAIANGKATIGRPPEAILEIL